MELNRFKDTPPWDWPENAKEILTEVLRSNRGDEDRVLAAELAGDLASKDDEIAEALLSIVSNAAESEQLRSRAAISLGPILEEAETEGYDDDFGEPPITKELFRRIQETFRGIYQDESAPTELRRRVLEASVRASQDWHKDAIRTAYSSKDELWKLTAVFCMRYVAGFDDEVMEALNSRNSDIHYEAVSAAGNWELDGAWPHIKALIASPKTKKPLLLAAIEAAGNIRPEEARAVLGELADSEDEDISEAANEAMLMADSDFDEDDEDEDEELRN